MCVILALETQKELDSLTLEILKSAESMNPDGNGYATLINGKVVFEKGISIESIWKKIQDKEIVSPCIIHCRITSIGRTTPSLCHPFVVNESSDNKMNGTIKSTETVLFHNGTFTGYKDLVLQTAMGSGRQLPKGDMSDTRGIAFVLQTLGTQALEYIDTGFNKFATLNAKQGLMKYGSWVDVDGITSSNNYYGAKKTVYYNNGYTYDEFNDEDTLWYAKQAKEARESTEHIQPEYNPHKAQKSITEFRGKPLDSKVTKKEHKMNIKFLKEHGWKTFKNYTRKELQKIVNSMQKQNQIVDEIKKTQKLLSEKKEEHSKIYGTTFEDSYDLEDYEDVRNYQMFSHDGAT